MENILRITEAVKRYAASHGPSVTALDGVSLAVGPREFVTLLGPSGCGKTTLLRAISGFEDLDSGTVEIDGKDVTHLPAHRRPVNTVFQRYALFPHLSVAGNVAYSLEIAGTPRAETRGRVGEMLELVGLAGYGDRKITQLSGGQQQRVALARALVARPRILLLDEPLSALDKTLRKKMQQELKSLQAEVGIAFVFVTHDQEEALAMSDRIAVLSAGRIRQVGAPEDLYRRPETEFVARFVGEGNLISARITASGRDGATALLEDGQHLPLPPGALAAGQQVTLLVRPEEVRPGPARHPDDLEFEGRIAEVTFVGADYQVQVVTPAGQQIKATLRPAEDERAALTGQRSRITLHVPRKTVHLIPGTASA